MTDELRCKVCGVEAQSNQKGRLVLTHVWSRHDQPDSSETPATPLRRPVRTGAYGDDDD